MPLLACFALSLVTVLGLTPAVRHLARRADFIDRPARRKVHIQPVPLGGGVALAAGVVAGVVAWAFVGAAEAGADDLRSRYFLAVMSGLAWAVAMGLRDDSKPLAPGWKLAGQFAAAAILVLGSGRPSPEALHGFGVPLALVGVVGLMNACNFLDNMDGILSGIALVCAGAFLVIAPAESTPIVAVAAALAAATAGATAGFLAYNFAPARIFMGDAGSLAIGFLLAAIALGMVPSNPRAPEGLGLLLILGYPLFDLAFVTITRLRDHRKVWTPGKDHSSHRLDRLLMDPRRTALAVYGLAAMMAVAGVAVRCWPGPWSAFIALLGGAALCGIGVRLARVPPAR
jgi:UDP-GlcNAc:undecaprenyl-phosphate GlcNAc-1-phosphate transferase